MSDQTPLLPAETPGAQPVQATPATLLTGDAPVDVVRAYLQRQSPNTRDAYARDVMVFARFLAEHKVIHSLKSRVFSEGVATQAAKFMLSRKQGDANAIALKFRDWMIAQTAPDGGRMSGATVDRRLSALKSLVRIGGILGIITWRLDVPGVGVKGTSKTRDVRGPGTDGVKALYGVLNKRYEAALRFRAVHPHRSTEARLLALAVLRDRAILSLLYMMALRRFEVGGILVCDLNVPAKKLRVRRKGEGGASRVLTVPGKALEHLQQWIREGRAGQESDDPVFVSLNNLQVGINPMSDQSIYNVIVGLGKDAGLKTWPHGLRHTAITEALDKHNGDVRSVAKFSGHKSIQTVYNYDDDRRDTQGKIANTIGDWL